MGNIQEHDAMICRACGNEERASEGYPCRGCGRFICLMCDLRGVTLCRECQEKQPSAPPLPGAPKPPQ
ncbi:MAG: hypothetical protein ACHQWU_08745, partial [Gemmatimonadales bacterium]